MFSEGTVALLFYNCLQLCRYLYPGHKLDPVSGVTMPTSDTPALNPDSTLKDASEIEWLNSPSDENCTVSLEDPKKCKRTNSEQDTDELPSVLKEIALA